MAKVKILMAAATLYFDDSGTHPGAPVAIAAAWIAPLEQWKRFSREWEKLKKEEQFECFHMAEFMANNPKSEFADRKEWNEKRKAKLVKRIASIIKTRATKGFALGVSQKDYSELVQGELRDIAGKYHYTYVVANVIGQVEKWRENQALKEPIEYIFDYMKPDDERRKEIDSVFDFAVRHSSAMDKYGIHKGCHSFRDKCEVFPLQAADLWAWTMYQRSQLFYSGRRMPPIAQDTFNDLILHKSKKFTDAGYIDRKQLAEWVARKPTRIPADLP